MWPYKMSYIIRHLIRLTLGHIQSSGQLSIQQYIEYQKPEEKELKATVYHSLIHCLLALLAMGFSSKTAETRVVNAISNT